MEDRTSFMMRSPSPSYIKQLLDQSSYQYQQITYTTNNNETSILDGKLSLLRKQESMRAASRAIGGQIMTDNNFLNDSELPKVMEFSVPDNGPFQVFDQFADFDYAEPPLAEMQILRVLDSHIKRKRKDHLDKARKFKEELLKKKYSGD